MDLNMPELDGVEATRRVITNQPTVAVLILTMFDDDDSVFKAMRAGARGYLLKGADRAESSVPSPRPAAGKRFFGPTVAQRIAFVIPVGSTASCPIAPCRRPTGRPW